jgi:hypothetical protein
MNISKLTKALSPANLAETCEITISPAFSITIHHVSAINQSYNAATAKFALVNPQHPLFTDFASFWPDLAGAKVTPYTLQFLAHVVVADWMLLEDPQPALDEEGNPLLREGGMPAMEDPVAVPYSPEAFIELMTGDDQFQRSIPTKLLQACLAPSTFKVDLIVKS